MRTRYSPKTPPGDCLDSESPKRETTTVNGAVVDVVIIEAVGRADMSKVDHVLGATDVSTLSPVIDLSTWLAPDHQWLNR